MLTHIKLKSFKSFEAQGVELAPLTVLVGANAAGKSNFLDAIRFLHGLSLSSPLSIAELLNGRSERGTAEWPGIRGGSQEVLKSPARTFGIESSWKTISGHTRLVHSIECSISPDPAIRAERLQLEAADRPLFLAPASSTGPQRSRQNGRELTVSLHRASSSLASRATLESTHSLLTQVEAVDRVDRHIIVRARDLLLTLKKVQFLEIDPRRMRGYDSKDMSEIGMHGENISALLWRECQDSDAKDDLIDWLNEICAPELEDIDFIKTDLGEVMLRFVERGGGKVSARSISDGTLRFLGELMALRTAFPGSIVIMEEIENGLHPARIGLLVNYLEFVTKERGVQIIATTHSPQVLHALSSGSLEKAILFARMSGEPSSLMRQVGLLPHFDHLIERRDAVDVLTTQWLERDL